LNYNNHIEDDEIDFRKIALNLKKYFKMILFLTFISTSIAGIYAYFLPPLYSSSVILSFSNQKMSKLASIIPEEFSRLTSKASELETIKLTIKTRKFINSVIKDLNLKERYFIQHKVDFIPQGIDFIKKRLKKEELYSFKNLEVELHIYNALHQKIFKIEPIDSQSYILNIKRSIFIIKRLSKKIFQLKLEKKGYY
jgi:uncharacterized protein involved in exopolysaccharide biosynthesis